LWLLFIPTSCSFFLLENETSGTVIHHFVFWCKITKFISFFSKKGWKTFEKGVEKDVYIHLHNRRLALFTSYSLFIHRVFHRVIHTFFTFLFFKLL